MKRIVSMVVILAGLWGRAGISPYAGLWQVVFKGSSSATAERDWSRSVWAVPEGADWQTQRRRELGPILAYNFGDPSSKSKVASAVHGDEVHWFDYSQVAYAGFIYLEGDKTYKFRSNIDDDCYLKIVDAGTKTATVLLDFSDNAPHTSEAFSVSRTGWHACEIRMGNGYGGAGGNARDSSVSCGISGDGGQTWRKLMDPGDGSLFRIHDVYPVRLGLAYSEKASLSCVLTQDGPHREALAVFAYADTIDKGPTNVTWASHFSLGAWPCGSTNFVARLAALPASARIVRFAIVPNGDWPRATWLDAVKVEDIREREESAPAFLDCVIGSVDHTSANLVVNVLSQGLGGTSATLLKQVCREDGEWEMDAEAVKTASDLVGSLSVVQEGLCPGAAYRFRFAVSNNLGKVVWSDPVKVTTAAESFGNSTSFPGLWQARFVGANADWTKNPFDVAEGTDWQTQRRRELGPLLAYATREQRMTSRVWDDQVYWLEQNDNQWIYVGYIHLEASRAYKFRSKIDDNERITITDFGTGRTTTLLEDTIGRSEVLTSAAYTPSVTGWHRIEIRFSDGAGGAGGYDSASDFLNTNNLGFSSDDGATWQLLLDPGDGSLLLPERPEPVRVCETFFDGTTLAAALGRNEPPPFETGHANVFAVFDTAYHGDTLSAWPTARRLGLGVWKGAASTFVAQVAGLSDMRYLRFVTVSPDGARQHWSETICLPETPRRDGARAVFHAAHVTTTNTASASFHVDLLSQGTNCTAATLGLVYAYADVQGRHCVTNIIAEGASIAGSYDHEIKSIPAGTAYTAYFFVVDNHGVATRYPEGADGIAFSTFPASYILSACAESAVVRYDARTNYPGRLVRGTLTVGDVEGRVPSPWDTSLLADGWHRVSRGGAESDELMVLNNPEVEIEEGRIELNEVWTAEKTHLVRNTIYIPLWRRLKIEAGAVVKFCEGTGIKIEDGGALEIVGEEGRDVIFTSADDDSVGVKIVGAPSGGVPLRGIWRQSGNAIFSDNNFVQMRGMAYGDYATVSMNDTVAFRASGVANVPVTLNGANRKQPFSIDWVARDGSAKLGADYTLAAGRVTWGQSDDGTKIISIPLVVDHRVGSNTVFSIEIITNRAVNVGRRACTVTVREWDTLDIRTDRKESAAVRFDARTNTPGRVVHGVEAVTAGGNDDERTVSDWDTTTLADGWNTLTKGTNTLALLTLNDPCLAVEEGRLAANTLWASNVTHVLRNTVVVPCGVTLTVTTNAVVKFMEGTGIKVEDGGRLNVVGAPGEDVIFTAANDGTAGASVPGVGEGEISHRGFWKQSAGAAFADNGFIQTRNWRTGLYPEVWLNDTTAFRSTGMAAIPVTINGTRDQVLSIEWRAVDGTAKYGVDYTLKAGRVAWNKANEGTKIIEIPLVKERVVGTPVSFTLEITVNRGVNVSRRVCTVEIREFETRAFASAHAASAATRFDARRTTLFRVCHGTEWIAGGLLDTTTFKDGWRGVSGLDAGTNATTGIYCLNRPQIAVEEGRLARNTLWTSNATHVLRNWVVVPRGVTLTVTTNAVVKMFPETGIRIEDGGRLDVVGAPGADVVFTSVADDTAGEPIAGFESITNRLVGGIVAQSGAATFTDNACIQTRSFGGAPGYGTVTLHDAAADRANGVVYVPLTIATNRKQPFSVDWVATDGTAKHGVDYTATRGTVTWNRSDDGTKWIRVPLTLQKTGERRTFTITLTTARGILVARGAATVTIDELDAAKTHGAVTLFEGMEASRMFAIDARVGDQPIFLADAVPVTYSGRWQTQRAARETIARVSVESDNGLVRLGEFPGDAEGTLTLDLSAYRTGCYTLRHEILAKGEENPLHTATKTFSVVDRDSVELHGGTLTRNETWKAGKVHVVYATVVVPGIYTLFIEPGAIVKFLTGTGIDISQGGALFANGIVFTHINDDTVGGDTLADGYTVAPPMDAYFLTGNFTFGDDAELRNITQKTVLTGTLNGTKMLSKGSTYRVSGTFTIANGATLTIPAGTVLKMEPGAQIVVNAGGTLKANGTRAAPVVFTSINDDSYSGKTEGSNSNPQPGDWTRIAVNGTAFFDFTRILYSSRNSTTGAINMNGGTTTFINSEIAHCAYDAVGVESGHFYMTNSIITDALLAFRHWARDPIVNSVIYNCGRLTQGGGQHFVNCVFSQISETWEAFGFPQNGTTYRNCVFWNEGGSVLTGEGHQDALTVCGKNGNIWGDPLFVDPANGDFRIREGSPCVDAADSSAAPELDYFGQPRITFTGRTNDTELAEGPLADIGICEVMPRDVTSDIDLVPEAVRTEKTATPGQLLFVKWEVRNQGGAPVDATWRDTVSLVSQDGREVVLGDKTTKSAIAVGGSVFCSGYFTVPAMAEGTWYPKVNVNSYHDIFEGSLTANNALVGENPVSVELKSVSVEEGDELEVAKGTTLVIRLKGAGDAVVIETTDLTGKLLFYSGTFGIPRKLSCFAKATYLGAGRYSLSLPSDSSTCVISIVNNSNEDTICKFTTNQTMFSILSISMERIPNNGTSVVDLKGIGFSGLGSVRLIGTHTSIIGHIVSSDMTSARVSFDATGCEIGSYSLICTIEGTDHQTEKHITVFKTTLGPKIKLSVESPKSYRVGRWYNAIVHYENVGDINANTPIITISGKGVNFKNPDNRYDVYRGQIHLAGIADSQTPFVLRPGEKGTIRLAMQPTEANYNIGWNVSIPGVDSVPMEHVFSQGDKSVNEWKSLLASIKECYGTDDATGFYQHLLSEMNICQLNGATFYCLEPFMSTAIRKVYGKNRIIVVAKVVESVTEDPCQLESVSADGALSVVMPVNDDGIALFYDAGMNWTILPQSSDHYVDVHNVVTNGQIQVAEVGIKEVSARTGEGQFTEGMLIENASTMAQIKLLDLDSEQIALGWVDAKGTVNIGKLVNGVLVSDTAFSDGTMSIQEWYLHGTETLVVNGIKDDKSVLVVLDLSNKNGDYSLTERGRVTFDERMSKLAWKDNGQVSFRDGYKRLLLRNGVALKQSERCHSSVSPMASMPMTLEVDLSAAGVCGLGFSGSFYEPPLEKIDCCRWNSRTQINLGGEVYIGCVFKKKFEADWKIGREMIVGCGGGCGDFDISNVQYGIIKADVTCGLGGEVTLASKEIVLFASTELEAFLQWVENMLAEGVNPPTKIGEIFRINGNVDLSASATGGVYGEYEALYHGVGVDPVKKWGVGVFGRLGGKVSVGVGTSLLDAGIKVGTRLAEVSLETRFGYHSERGINGKGTLSCALGNYATGECNISWSRGTGWVRNGDWHINLGTGVYHGGSWPTKENDHVIQNSYVNGNENIVGVSERKTNSDGSSTYVAAEQNPKDGGVDDILTYESQRGESVKFNELKNVMWYDTVTTVSDADFWGSVVCDTIDGEGSSLYEISSKNGVPRYSVIASAEDVADVKVAVNPTGRKVVITEQSNSNGRYKFVYRRKNGSHWMEPITITNDVSDLELVGVKMTNDVTVVVMKTKGNDTTTDLVVVNFSENHESVICVYPAPPTTTMDISTLQFVPRHETRNMIKENGLFTVPAKRSIMVPHDTCQDSCVCGCRKYGCGCPKDCKCNGNCEEGSCKCGGGDGGNGVGSYDPNEMVGPAGLGDPETERYVKPGEWMTYTVYFENRADATAAAQEVRVTNPLSEYLDWSTFEMGEVAFNNQIDLGLSGKRGGTSEAAMKGTNTLVRTQLTLDEKTGTAEWYLRIVDPTTATGWPEDVFAGFLPPNDETFRGEGHLTYRVKVRDDAPHGVRIDNSASIVFDYNEPIETDPSWWNTVAPTEGMAKFSEADILAEEGTNVTFSVLGGNAYNASSVKLYLTYNTAAAADIDLKNGAVDSSTGGSPVPNAQAARSTNLKFPLTLTWAAGEIGEKTISIPVLADKAIEDAEQFTLQLADPVGMELGETRLCTVTINDPGYAELEAKIAADTATKAEQTAWDKLQKAKAPYIRGVADPANAGKVTGSGLCASGKKVTLKAAANKGYVFTGWLKEQIALDGDRLVTNAVEYVATTPSLVIDRTAKPAKDTATSTTLTNVNESATFYATFITTDEDKAAVGLTLNGGEVSQSEGRVPSLTTNIMCGVALNWPLASSALSATTVKVAGLPAGLKFTAKDIMKKGSKTEVEIPANTIYGAPTAASKIDKKTGLPVPSAVKVTVTTAGKSSVTYLMNITVDALPDWAVGNFEGFVRYDENDGGFVTMSITAAGKVSGKIAYGGTNWTFKADSYDITSETVGSTNFIVETVAVSGKATRNLWMTITDIGRDYLPDSAVAFVDGNFGDMLTEMHRLPWKDKDDAAAAALVASYAGAYSCTVPYGEDAGDVTFILDEKGMVKGTVVLPDGAKTRKATFSSNALTGDSSPSAVIALPPDAKKGYPAVFKVVNLVNHSGEGADNLAFRDPGVMAAVAELTAESGAIGTVSVNPKYGQVAPGKDVTLTTKAAKGSVFHRWVITGVDTEGLDLSSATLKFKMADAGDVFATAVFVTAEEDVASIALSVDALGGEISPEAIISVTNTCGVALKWSVAADALSQPTVAVSGLPAGLKFTAKDIMKKDSKTEVEIPANTIYGAPTAESKLDAKTGLRQPSAVKFTVTTAGKSKRVYPIDMTVLPLPDWAVGTFNGGGDLGQVSLTIAKTGKLSGKYLSEGLTWTLASDSFDSIDASGDVYRATLIGKSGKLVMTNEIGVAGNAIGGYAEAIDYIAYQNNWKLEPWKSVGKPFAKAAALEYEDSASVAGVPVPGVLSLKFAASGAVTVKGSFITGINEKTGKEILYSASGTAVLAPSSEPDEIGAFDAVVFVYLPPKAGEFDGYVRCIGVRWTGEGWIKR